jgi:3-oxoacyl-[acyl-carrier protein] reductase
VGNGPYGASKGGIDGFVKAMTYELSRYKIRINAISPGLVETDMGKDVSDELNEEMKKRQIHGRHVYPEELAKLAVFLIGPDSEFITGQTI